MRGVVGADTTTVNCQLSIVHCQLLISPRRGEEINILLFTQGKLCVTMYSVKIGFSADFAPLFPEIFLFFPFEKKKLQNSHRISNTG